MKSWEGRCHGAARGETLYDRCSSLGLTLQHTLAYSGQFGSGFLARLMAVAHYLYSSAAAAACGHWGGNSGAAAASEADWVSASVLLEWKSGDLDLRALLAVWVDSPCSSPWCLLGTVRAATLALEPHPLPPAPQDVYPPLALARLAHPSRCGLERLNLMTQLLPGRLRAWAVVQKRRGLST